MEEEVQGQSDADSTSEQEGVDHPQPERREAMSTIEVIKQDRVGVPR